MKPSNSSVYNVWIFLACFSRSPSHPPSLLPSLHSFLPFSLLLWAIASLCGPDWPQTPHLTMLVSLLSAGVTELVVVRSAVDIPWGLQAETWEGWYASLPWCMLLFTYTVGLQALKSFPGPNGVWKPPSPPNLIPTWGSWISGKPPKVTSYLETVSWLAILQMTLTVNSLSHLRYT